MTVRIQKCHKPSQTNQGCLVIISHHPFLQLLLMAPWLRGMPSSSKIYEYIKKGTNYFQNVIITFLTSRSSINFHDGLFSSLLFFANEVWGQKPWQAVYSHSKHCIPLGYGQHLGPVEHDPLLKSLCLYLVVNSPKTYLIPYPQLI